MLKKIETVDGIVVGTLEAFVDGCPSVDFPGNPVGGALPALSIVALSSEDIGAKVALSFERGEPDRPIVLGRMQLPSTRPPSLDLCAEREVTIRCGKASITLTREGKIILRGTYISSRSSGVNRIKGGSVHLN